MLTLCWLFKKGSIFWVSLLILTTVGIFTLPMEKHAGFIINRGNATASDVLALVEHIKKVILEQFGCALECEMIYVK